MSSKTDDSSRLGKAPVAELRQEAPLYWIHCNRCFDIYVLRQRRHFILACHHVACDHCVRIFPNEIPGGPPSFTCPVCRKHVRGRQLGNVMPEHIKQLFHPEPWIASLPTQRVLFFQQKQRQHFTDGMRRVHQNYIREAKSSTLAYAATKALFEEYESVCRERKQSERRVRQLFAQRKRKALEQARENALGVHSSSSTTPKKAGYQSSAASSTTTISGHGKRTVTAAYREYRSQPPQAMLRSNPSQILNFTTNCNASFNL